MKLTEEEKERLIDDYGESFFEMCVKVLDEYKEQTGKKYKNDNLAIRKWVVDAVKKKGVKSNGNKEQRKYYEENFF